MSYGIITDFSAPIESCYNIVSLQAIDTTNLSSGSKIYCEQVGLFYFNPSIENMSNYDVFALNNQGSWRLNRVPILAINTYTSTNSSNNLGIVFLDTALNNFGMNMLGISGITTATTYTYYDLRITSMSILFTSMNNSTNDTYVSVTPFDGYAIFTFSQGPGTFQVNLWIYNPLSNSNYYNLARIESASVISFPTLADIQAATNLIPGKFYYAVDAAGIYTFTPNILINQYSNTTIDYIYTASNGNLFLTVAPWYAFNYTTIDPFHSNEYFPFIGSYTQSGNATQIYINLTGNFIKVGQPVFLQILSISSNVSYSAEVIFDGSGYQLLVQWSSTVSSSNFNYFICN